MMYHCDSYCRNLWALHLRHLRLVISFHILFHCSFEICAYAVVCTSGSMNLLFCTLQYLQLQEMFAVEQKLTAFRYVCTTTYWNWQKCSCFQNKGQCGWPGCTIQEKESLYALTKYPIYAPRPTSERHRVAACRRCSVVFSSLHWHIGILPFNLLTSRFGMAINRFHLLMRGT